MASPVDRVTRYKQLESLLSVAPDNQDVEYILRELDAIWADMTKEERVEAMERGKHGNVGKD